MGNTGNSNLARARKDPRNEFYTQFPDIEREMNAYLEYDPNVFRDKTVLLPCDDPEWSNFTRYFAQQFMALGLKKLISTSYAPNKKIAEVKPQLTLFEKQSPQYDQSKSQTNGRIFVIERDANHDAKINIEDLEWEYLEGDGDFRSDEVTKLLEEADIVITNPPFSLFREFLSWLTDADKRFVIIGSISALTYNEVFPLVQSNQVWLGATGHDGDMVFAVPPGTEVKPADREKAARLGYEGDYTRLGNSCWFTNINHGRRFEPLALMTTADNIKYSKHKTVKGIGYREYDNYNAIEVPRIDAIPSDHAGVMGVPVSFLSKYDPDQFRIIGRDYDIKQGLLPELLREGWEGKTDRGYIDGRRLFGRIFIQHRKPVA